MRPSLRFSALALIIAAACGGQKFEPNEPAAGGQAGAMGGAEGTTGGAPEAGLEGGAAGRGEAGLSDRPGAGGQAGGRNDGDGGSAGESESCAEACGADEECAETPTGHECRCVDGWVPDGAACRLPHSCDELHRYAPSLPSGAYSLKSLSADKSFLAYCGMMLEGGGWTLVVNEGKTFDPTTQGVADALCYSSSCTNIAYSLVPLTSDVMIDVSNSPIANTTYTARLIVTGVHSKSRGKTLRTLFTTGPNYVEAENNSNLAVRMRDGADCSTLPTDLAKIACEKCEDPGCKTPVIVFGDGDADPSCRAGAVPRLAIGGASDYATPWANCAGWPQDPDYAGVDFYPDYVRVWIR
jgi:hypothetical protein